MKRLCATVHMHGTLQTKERECEYRLDLFVLILEKLYPFVDDWY